MTNKPKSEPVQLSREDHVRVARLDGEAFAKLEEAARVVSQTLGLEPKFPIRKMILTQEIPQDLTPRRYQTIEVTWDDGSVTCYDDDAGMCCIGPCPC
jgi:hypothetical protein